MDFCAIPFPTGRTVAERPGGSNGGDDVHRNEEDVSRDPLQLTVVMLSRKPFQVEAFASDSVLDLKLLVYRVLGLSADLQELIYEGQILADSDTLEECGINDGARVMLITRIRGGDTTAVVLNEEKPWKLSIWIRRGRCVVVSGHRDATVGSIKQSIENLTGLPAAHQTLTVHGQDMSDEHTLEHYGAYDRSVVFLTVNAAANISASTATVNNSQ
uniref:Ubiquitin C n=1 Tax=Rhipicephalus appendiculatus TaxID=34631 RepID=A0A131Z3V3_RHIAP